MSRRGSALFTDHAAEIRVIDEEMLELAARNVMRGRRPRRDVEPEPGAPPAAEPMVPDIALPVGRTNRFLVVQVPKGDYRWHQVHFNKDVIARFFRVQPNTAQRVYLVECRQDGTFGEQEVRPCVYSQANKNLKIEIASHHGDAYPGGWPTDSRLPGTPGPLVRVHAAHARRTRLRSDVGVDSDPRSCRPRAEPSHCNACPCPRSVAGMPTRHRHRPTLRREQLTLSSCAWHRRVRVGHWHHCKPARIGILKGDLEVASPRNAEDIT